jgi:hypothetical protein
MADRIHNVPIPHDAWYRRHVDVASGLRSQSCRSSSIFRRSPEVELRRGAAVGGPTLRNEPTHRRRRAAFVRVISHQLLGVLYRPRTRGSWPDVAEVLVVVRHLCDVPWSWLPAYHSALVLSEEHRLPLAFSGDKGQGMPWPWPTRPHRARSCPARIRWAPLVTYELPFTPGHADFDSRLALIHVRSGMPYLATRARIRALLREIDTEDFLYQPLRCNCNAVVSTLLDDLACPLPPIPVHGWLPGYGVNLLTR